MKELRIETGVQQYKLAEDCIVEFNPTDSEFASRLFKVYDSLEEIHQRYRDELASEDDVKKIFATSKDIEAEMRSVLNGIFDKDICTPICGDISVYAISNGAPIWANILLALIDEMSDVLTEEQKKTQKRVSKYTKKYHS